MKNSPLIKYTLVFLLGSGIAFSGFSQVKVKNNGFLGVGTLDPLCRLHVMGEACFQNGSFNTVRIIPGNPGVEIGSSTNRVDFWFAGQGYHKLYAKSFTKMSDARLKRDIIGIPNCVEILQQLRPVNYELLSDTTITSGGNRLRDYGFIAQEVAQVLPDIVSESGKGLMGIDYDAVVPILVGAIQEQQKQIDQLKQMLEKQSEMINALNPSRNSGALNASETFTGSR